MKITNIHKNCFGTISFDAKFSGMRKEQDFIIYPNPENELVIQSDNRIGYISKTGDVVIAKAKNRAEFGFRPKVIDKLDNIGELLESVRKTSSSMAGNNGIVFVDNSTAANI
jgi:hypothetical protein